jgi:hypothetical protein
VLPAIAKDNTRLYIGHLEEWSCETIIPARMRKQCLPIGQIKLRKWENKVDWEVFAEANEVSLIATTPPQNGLQGWLQRNYCLGEKELREKRTDLHCRAGARGLQCNPSAKVSVACQL